MPDDDTTLCDRDFLDRYIAEHIPIARQLGVSVADITNSSIQLKVPLAPNLNHRETAFGGSLSAVAILAGWGLLHHRCRTAKLTPSPALVIQNSQIDFQQPVRGDFIASVAEFPEDQWQRFLRCLQRHGKARVELTTVISCDNQTAARHTGLYVALNPG